MASWDDFEKRAAAAASGGRIAKLNKDGDKITGMFRGDPEVVDLYWDEKKGAFETYTEAHKKQGLKPSPNYRINFAEISFQERGEKEATVHESPVMRALEFNSFSAENLVMVKKKYGLQMIFELELKIVEKGGNKRKTIHMFPEVKVPLTPDLLAKIEKLEMHDLLHLRAEELEAAAAAANGAAPNGAAAPEERVDKTAMAPIIARIKALPDYMAWAKKVQDGFGIKSLMELTKAKLPELEGLLAGEEARLKTANAPVDDGLGGL